MNAFVACGGGAQVWHKKELKGSGEGASPPIEEKGREKIEGRGEKGAYKSATASGHVDGKMATTTATAPPRVADRSVKKERKKR
jgi:hypothetical protein